MKVYAMSDIHGYLQEFEVALSNVDLSGENILILLGDYIHGPDSYRVLDRIIELQEHNQKLFLKVTHKVDDKKEVQKFKSKLLGDYADTLSEEQLEQLKKLEEGM